jgi:hypothetical protein
VTIGVPVRLSNSIKDPSRFGYSERIAEPGWIIAWMLRTVVGQSRRGGLGAMPVSNRQTAARAAWIVASAEALLV